MVILLGLFGLLTAAPNNDVIPMSHWVGPPGSHPGTYREWIAGHPYEPLSFRLVKTVHGTDLRPVALVVDSVLMAPLQSELDQFSSDLQLRGYAPVTYQVSGGTPASLRQLLQLACSTQHIEGALFIGNLPVAWYQIKVDPGNNNNYAEWPIDLYYMDLNGTWLDTMRYDPVETLVHGSDSIFDAHTGRVQPEIYVGRLVPYGLGDSIELLRNYFRKDHAYRTNPTHPPDRALVFIDDDWVPWANDWNRSVGLAFPNRDFFDDPESTRAASYRALLDTPYTWVSVCAHSATYCYGFYFDQRQQMDFYYGSEYMTQDPPANFYNHFACSFCRYTDPGCGGCASVFNPDHGLAALGSTKAGGMQYFDEFYAPLRAGRSLGGAFKDWFFYLGANGYYSTESVQWFYGMTLLGDPFLYPVTQRDVSVDEFVAPDVGAESGQAVVPRVKVSNRGNVRADFVLQLRIGSDYNDSASVHDVSPGETVIVALPSWLPQRLGTWAMVADIRPADLNPRNDTLWRDVTVYVPDVAAMQVLSPASTIDTLPLAPRAVVMNLGLAPQARCLVTMDIRDSAGRRVYLDSAQVHDVMPDSQAIAVLPVWSVSPLPADYEVTCWVWCHGDVRPGNDTVHARCHVQPGSGLPTGWYPRAPVPDFGVYNGGSLAATQSGRVYLFNGGYTCAFKEYDPVLDQWSSRESIPLVGQSGDSVPVGAGGSLVSVHDRLFATKGGSREFWEYVPDTSGAYPWVERASLPDSALLGARLCTAEPYVYFMQGGGRFGFCRYDPSQDVWTRCAQPDSLGIVPAGHGWGLAWDGANTIHALESDSNELIAYNIAGDSWYRLARLPFLNQVGDTTSARYATITHYGGRLFALKGHDSGEFWSYDCWFDWWSEMDSLPGRTRHQADAGAGIVCVGAAAALYAIKGNGLTEFWMAPLQAPVAVSEPSQPQAARLPTRFGLKAYPNPLSNLGNVTYSLPAPGDVGLKVYDIAGRARATVASGYHRAGGFTVRWDGTANDGRMLANGVYILRLDAGGRSETRTLTIAR
jgi:hypothetical protein